MDANMTMVTAGEASSSSSRKPKRFKIKKWNDVTLWLGGCAIMPSISTISVDGSKPAKCALLIITSGSSRSMATKIDGASEAAGSTLSFKPALGSKITCKQR